MADNKKIALRVGGTVNSLDGFTPLVSFNSPRFELDAISYNGFDGNSFFYVVKVESHQVVYKLVKNRVTNNAFAAESFLVIAFAIPAGFRLAGGKSPEEVLLRLKDAFLERCMTCKNEATEEYEYKAESIEADVLDDVAEAYKLEPCKGPYFPMTAGTPIGYVLETKEKISELLKDVRYAEFVNFSELVVAERVGETNYTPITNIQIPRQPLYRIMVDGVQKSAITETNRKIVLQSNKNEKCFDNSTIAFTIDELLHGTVPNVTIDKENELVNVDTKSLATPKEQTIHVKVTPDEAAAAFSNLSGMLTLKYGNRIIALADDLTFVLHGEEILWLDTATDFSVEVEENDAYRLSSFSIQDDELIVSLVKVVNTTAAPMKTLKSHHVKVNLFFNNKDLLDESNSIHVIAINEDNDERHEKNVHFENADEHYGEMVGELTLPAHWMHDRVSISFMSHDRLYKHPAIMCKQTELLERNFVRRNGITRRFMKWGLPLLLVLCLGAVAFYFAEPISAWAEGVIASMQADDEPEVTPQPETYTIEMIDAEPVPEEEATVVMVEEPAQVSLSRLDELKALADSISHSKYAGITFDMVKAAFKDAAAYKETEPEMYQLLEANDTLIAAIQNNEFRKVNAYAQEPKNASLCGSKFRTKLHALVYGFPNGKPYTTMPVVRAYFERHCTQWKSYEEMMQSADEMLEASGNPK